MSENENPAFDRQSFYDELIDLDQEASGNLYDVADDGAWYDELKDLDKGANETYDHPDAVPGRATPNPYEGLNAGNTTHDQPDTGPALPDRSTLSPTPNQYQNVNQETLKPTAAPDSLVPNITPVYLELIAVDEDKNQTAEC